MKVVYLKKNLRVAYLRSGLKVNAINPYTGVTNNGVSNTTFNTYTGTTAPAQFANKTVFNTYTGTTNTAINARLLTTSFNTYSASTLTNINSRLLTSAFNTYSGATLTNINSRLLTSAFNTYSGATLTNINSRLLTSAFNTYSASTLTAINFRFNSANNGLSFTGANVELGGNLTGNTNIGLSSFNLNFTGASGTITAGSSRFAIFNPANTFRNIFVSSAIVAWRFRVM